MSAEIRAARAFLHKRRMSHVPAQKFAAASTELGVDFTELLYLLGLLYDGPRSETEQRQRLLEEEQRKLSVTPATRTKR